MFSFLSWSPLVTVFTFKLPDDIALFRTICELTQSVEDLDSFDGPVIQEYDSNSLQFLGMLAQELPNSPVPWRVKQ